MQGTNGTQALHLSPAPVLSSIPEAGSSSTSSLLLPPHVSLALDEPSSMEPPIELPAVGDDDDEFIKYLDYDDVQKASLF